MLCQRLSHPPRFRQHSRPAAGQYQHYDNKRPLRTRSPILLALPDSNQQSGCHTLSQPDAAVQEDCQWPEPVPDDQQLLEAACSNGTGNSTNGSTGGQEQPTSSLATSNCCQHADARVLNSRSIDTSSSRSRSNSSSSSVTSETERNSSSLSDSRNSSQQQEQLQQPAQEQLQQTLQQQQESLQQQQQQQPWPPDVPWGLSKAFQVMGLWLLAYFATGQLLVPATLAVFDLDQAHLSARGSAVLNLALDILQVGITVGILARCLKKYEPLKRNLFPVMWQQGQWLGPVAAGATVFPVVDWLVHTGHTWSQAGLEVVQAPPDMWTAQIEAGLYSQDWLSCLAYILVVVVFAPIWEEAIFRGFLLRTLMKPFASHTAVLGSALMFALCHFNQDTFAPLVLLGVVFGWLYAKCNNLLPPMILHSLWNTYVLGTLVLRMRTGCDAVTCSVIMAVGTQVVLLLCGLVLLKLQQYQQRSQQQQTASSIQGQ